MVSTDASSVVFTNTIESFNARLLFGVPLYSSLVQHMDNYGMRYPHIQVLHEVRINSARYRYWFAHRRGSQVREVFSFSSIQVAPVPFNNLKTIIGGNTCIEFYVGGGVLL